MINMKKKIISFLCALLFIFACSKNSGSDNNPTQTVSVPEQNLQRAMQMVDKAVSCYFTGDGMAMARYYNPYTNVRSDEKGSIWMYTTSIEAVNAILRCLRAMKEEGNTTLFDKYFDNYVQLLFKLYDNADYYLGTFQLTSYTQTIRCGLSAN